MFKSLRQVWGGFGEKNADPKYESNQLLARGDDISPAGADDEAEAEHEEEELRQAIALSLALEEEEEETVLGAMSQEEKDGWGRCP